MQHVLGDRKRIARELSRRRVEGMGHQGVVPRVQQVARCVDRVRRQVQDDLVLAAVQRADLDGTFPLACTRPSGQVEEVPAVRQEPGPAVRLLVAALGDLGHRRGRAARGGDAVQRARAVGREDDHAVAVPGSAAAARRIAQGQRRAARGADLPQLAGREEADRRAVGRPERKARALRSGQRVGGQRVERAYVEQRLAVLGAHHEGQLPAVGRDGHRAGAAGSLARGEVARALGCGQRRAHRLGSRWSAAHEPAQRQPQRQGHRHQEPRQT